MTARATEVRGKILADIVDATKTVGRNFVHTEMLMKLISDMQVCFRHGGRFLICGNGGSAADAQHIAAEFVVRVKKNRRALPAVALTADSAILTAIGNDLSFEEIFIRQVEALGRPGDILICLSTSGRSKNVLRAADAARKKRMRVVEFTWKGGVTLARKAHVAFRIDGSSPSRIQEAYMNLLHIAATIIDESSVTAK